MTATPASTIQPGMPLGASHQERALETLGAGHASSTQGFSKQQTKKQVKNELRSAVARLHAFLKTQSPESVNPASVTKATKALGNYQKIRIHSKVQSYDRQGVQHSAELLSRFCVLLEQPEISDHAKQEAVFNLCNGLNVCANGEASNIQDSLMELQFKTGGLENKVRLALNLQIDAALQAVGKKYSSTTPKLTPQKYTMSIHCATP
ncbi:MAG: hypothetical protein HC848_10120 [Limnobacter sp.]|nr:hypothetical protein [Limnobacter sp.]